MLDKLISRTAYFDEGIFSEEIQQIYRSNYLFVGLTTELENNRDFVCLNMPGLSAVVQNFNGQLRAFHNVCSHRFNLIQWEARGNRPFTCRYHAWSYDAEGNPLGDRPSRLVCSDDSNTSLALRKLRLEICGKFVFVADESVRHTLREQLGDLFESIEELSGHFGKEIHFGEIPHAANWKLLVENVLECLHCSLVHKDTFLAKLGIGRMPLEGIMFSKNNSSAHAPTSGRIGGGSKDRVVSYLEKRKLKHKSFHHFYVFPNLFIASSEGASFYVGQAIPISSGKSCLRFRLFEPNIEYSPVEREIQNVLNEHNVSFSSQLISEDQQVIENVQKGIVCSDKNGCLDQEEVRIVHFMKTYNTIMNKYKQTKTER